MRLDLKGTAEQRRRTAAAKDTMLSVLAEASPEEISAWVDNNVQSLLDVKDLLKLLLNRVL